MQQYLEGGLPNSRDTTPHERWVIHALNTQGLDTLAGHKEHAYAVCAWLDGRAAHRGTEPSALMMGLRITFLHRDARKVPPA